MPAEPRILNDEEMAQVEALASVLTSEQLADYFGIARQTFYDIMKRQPDVSVRYKRGRAKLIGKIAQGVGQRALNGDNQCSFFYLKTQAGWKETVAQEHTSPDGSMTPTFQSMYGKPESDPS